MRILFKFIFIQVLNFEHDTDNFLSNSFRLDGYTKLVSLPQKSSIKFFLFHFFLLSTFMSIFFYLMINDGILLRLFVLNTDAVNAFFICNYIYNKKFDKL